MGVVDRNLKLQQLLVALTTFGVKERVRLEKEAAWLRIVQTTTGIGAMRASNAELSQVVVSNEVNDYLGL